MVVVGVNGAVVTSEVVVDEVVWVCVDVGGVIGPTVVVLDGIVVWKTLVVVNVVVCVRVIVSEVTVSTVLVTVKVMVKKGNVKV